MESSSSKEDSQFSLNLDSKVLPTISQSSNQFSLFLPPRLSPQSQAHSLNTSARPATAPPIERDPALLPSAAWSTSPDQVSALDPESLVNDGTSLYQDTTQVTSPEDHSQRFTTQTMPLNMPIVSFREDGIHPELGSLSSPFDTPFAESVPETSHSMDEPREDTGSDYDWATFITAYAHGRCDPVRTPHPPRPYLALSDHHSQHQTESSPLSVAPAIATRTQSSVVDVEPSLNASEVAEDVDDYATRLLSGSDSENTIILDSPPKANISASASVNDMLFRKPFSSHFHPSRKSFADFRSTYDSFSSSSPVEAPLSGTINPDIVATVATMRWAAARVNLAPLALPSPEHELTDPMRGVTAAIPGSHMTNPAQNYDVMTPGSSRVQRQLSFWEGTQDVGNESGRLLSTIQGSPSTTPPEFQVPTQSSPSETSWVQPLPRRNLPPAATAPLLRHEMTPGDYFGDTSSVVVHSDLSNPIVEFHMGSRPPNPMRRESIPMEISSVPALPRRICLTRQSSSPFPGSTLRYNSLVNNRAGSDPFSGIRAARSAKEGQMYAELGYLAPPNPPDELERRRALHKCNLWNTGSDINFDRTSHLAKLVFNTKGAFISLIDGHEQWFKSQWGVNIASLPRMDSICAHTILQRGDEPTVVLDTEADWRFAKNPLVVGPPHIRFYAGAPLRTQDGFNIGSLAILDDTPRQDFSPRQRHTLKEFAAITMREVELWSDKIQLRIRDRIQTSMEQFSRECLEIDTAVRKEGEMSDIYVDTSMEKVYGRAATLIKRTLDVENVVVMDVSHCEVVETMNAEGTVSVVMYHDDPDSAILTKSLTPGEYSKLNDFFLKYPDGKISEGILPICFRSILPTRIQYALTVPIFNIDKRPFALLCAYNASDRSKRFLEGHELSYLRAIGVIILSAVLKRRMMLADKAKSLFISNISHELRTPLHGILAAAELLNETHLTHTQLSFLHTVRACGTSLVETVNHVLDFTKLSGNVKSGGVDNVIVRSKVDLMQLVEEAIDGCWIGHRARTSALGESEIGSVYSPPKSDQHGANLNLPATSRHLEIVVDIGHREGGWILKCEKGGIRRILMNVFGNSLKFTSDGYIHVQLRQLPPTEDTPKGIVHIELSVIDTGKGISRSFLKNQLFHPFSQENPLQTGTGLGLAIVNSIVKSPGLGGKIDVGSEEGVGTDIKITFEAEVVEEQNRTQDPFVFEDPEHPVTVCLVGFRKEQNGIALQRGVLSTYLASWWGFEVEDDSASGEIVILNEDPHPVVAATARGDAKSLFIIFTATRRSPRLMGIASEYERIGGFCRILYKPGGPSQLRVALQQALKRVRQHVRRTSSTFSASEGGSEDSISLQSSALADSFASYDNPISPRESDNFASSARSPQTSFLPIPDFLEEDSISIGDPLTVQRNLSSQTVSIGNDGTLLKSAIRPKESGAHRFRVLVVEDNGILRTLLVKWLTMKGYDYCEGVDGSDGVDIYERDGPFDVVLLDLSMPVLDGFGAAAKIREFEASRENWPAARILALTGMSSLEDKRKAFAVGMDGYLVKPVPFKTLDDIFHKLGFL